MISFPPPLPENVYLAPHVALLRRSLRELAGLELTSSELSDVEGAQFVWEAPFVVLSHNTADDPVLTYGNRCALELFEMSWEQLTSTPSRLTAEQPERAERDRLLTAVSENGYIDSYSGIRVSRHGRRFRINQATVWNLIDTNGTPCGQAAMFDRWEFL